MIHRLVIAAALAALAAGCKRTSEPAASPLATLAKACHDSEISCPRPIFTVDDLAASTRYYRDALGFKIDWVYGEPPDFGSVSRGDGVLFLCQRCQGQPGAWTMMFARDVDQLHDDFVERGARVKMPPTDMPWGLREMNVADLDGNILRFGSGIDD
ncbi:MAG TPA: glyoxalase superfamily protein [Kofleriaceae bacterium]|jgi:catechol 2,3-dioxygenase-like lactoylglutathione lyase family enzyme|nr:glyoxalase superfamily protein [Kofleriaceae bacterium]